MVGSAVRQVLVATDLAETSPTLIALGVDMARKFGAELIVLYVFLQADAAAEHLAAEILGTAPECSFEPTSMCVMEQFDKATFAQVPLRLTGVADKAVEVRPDLPGLYRVGSSATWRLGKKLLGVYLPWRFAAGEPFHAGLPWKGMEVGLKVMSRMLAA